MKLLERILVATDLGPGSDDAVQTALLVAKTFRSDVVLLHVVPSTPAPFVAMAATKEPTVQRLHRIADRFKAEGSQVVEPLIASGVPYDRIVAHADQHDVNVVIMGSGEQSDAESFHVGITAIDVFRNATKPVWVVKRGAPPQIDKIVCPVDFSAPSRRALTNAVHLSRSFDAQLTVLHVVRPLSRLFLGLGRVSPASQQTHFEAQQAQFERFLRNFDFHDVRWTKATRQGDPQHEILALAAQTEANLIVIGSEPRSDIARMLMGSVAEDVVGEIPCSVVTVKSAHVIRLRLDAPTGDIKAQCSEAQALLDKGFPVEARHQFEQAVTRDRTYTPAWEGLATVYRRLGDEKQAEKCRETAKKR